MWQHPLFWGIFSGTLFWSPFLGHFFGYFFNTFCETFYTFFGQFFGTLLWDISVEHFFGTVFCVTSQCDIWYFWSEIGWKSLNASLLRALLCAAENSYLAKPSIMNEMHIWGQLTFHSHDLLDVGQLPRDPQQDDVHVAHSLLKIGLVAMWWEELKWFESPAGRRGWDCSSCKTWVAW